MPTHFPIASRAPVYSGAELVKFQQRDIGSGPATLTMRITVLMLLSGNPV